MDNENQVSKVQIFLQDSLSNIKQERHSAYNLFAEFAKTRHNRDYFVIKVISITVLVVLLLAGALTAFISVSSRNVKVDISVFEDLNLRKILDVATHAEDELDSLAKERAALDSRFLMEQENLASQKSAELEILALQRITTDERSRRKAEIERMYAIKARELKARYAPQIAALDSELAEKRKQIEAFDTKRVESAREQKQLMDSQRDLFEIERNQMQSVYEARVADMSKRIDEIQKENAKLRSEQIRSLVDDYKAQLEALDPAFGDVEATQLLTEAAPVADSAPLPFSALPAVIPADLGVTAEDFARMQRGYQGVGYLLNRVSSIPYVNEAGSYVNAARKLALVNGASGEKIIIQAFDRIGKLDASLSESVSLQQETARELTTAKANLSVTGDRLSALKTSLAGQNSLLAASAAENGYDGYVTDFSDPSSPGLLLLAASEKVIFAGETRTAYIYRGTKTLVATVELSHGKDGSVVATVTKNEKKRVPALLDYVRIEKK